MRERLRSKELWVEGADRYRNPDEDLPRDFAKGRDAYYKALKLPREADLFVDRLRDELGAALAGSTAAWGEVSTSAFSRRMAAGSTCPRSRRRPSRRTCLSSRPI